MALKSREVSCLVTQTTADFLALLPGTAGEKIDYLVAVARSVLKPAEREEETR